MDLDSKTLIIAFDGLDFNLIQEFELNHIDQEEFGGIDNETGMSRKITTELFASFITGETYEEHGVKGLQYFDGGWKGRLIEKTVNRPIIMNNVRGSHRALEVLLALMDVRRRRHRKEDLKTDSIFEKVDNSRSMFVPGHSPDMFWETRCEAQPLEYGYGTEEYLKFWDTRAYEHRKRALFSELDFISRPLLMCHFHRPDLHQHIYGDESSNYQKDRLLSLYKETDKLAGKIKQKAKKVGYERIIFMSDHGLPEGRDHNKEAFYSSNKKLFGNETPKITSFHQKILN